MQCCCIYLRPELQMNEMTEVHYKPVKKLLQNEWTFEEEENEWKKFHEYEIKRMLMVQCGKYFLKLSLRSQNVPIDI